MASDQAATSTGSSDPHQYLVDLNTGSGSILVTKASQGVVLGDKPTFLLAELPEKLESS
jgi:hypothetical protein